MAVVNIQADLYIIQKSLESIDTAHEDNNPEKLKINLEKNIKDRLNKICEHTIKDKFYENHMYAHVEKEFPEKHKQDFHKRYTEHTKEKKNQRTQKNLKNLALVLTCLGLIGYFTHRTLKVFNENKTNTNAPQTNELKTNAADTLQIQQSQSEKRKSIPMCHF